MKQLILKTSMKSLYRNCLGCFLVLLLIPGLALAQTKPIRVGILPTLSPRELLIIYESVRSYLTQELHQPVQLGTATDFGAFHQQTLAGEYDVVVTAAHLARLAQREQGWLPVATYQTANRVILLTAKATPIKTVEDLRGTTITSLDPVALIVIQGRRWLSEKGLQSNRDYQFVTAPSFTSAVHAMLQKQAALVIVSPASYKHLPDDLKQETQVFQTLPEIPSLIWMLNPKARIDAAQLKRLLLNFTAERAEGQLFFQRTGYKGLREVSNEQMLALDIYADEVKHLLKSK